MCCDGPESLLMPATYLTSDALPARRGLRR
jgi:hypothetical protein